VLDLDICPRAADARIPLVYLRRPHRYAEHKMRPTVADVAMSVRLCVYLGVGHNREPITLTGELIAVQFGL